MVKLKTYQYKNLLSLIRKVSIDKVFALSVLENIQDGLVYVDSIRNSQVALIIQKTSGFSLLVGKKVTSTICKEIFEFILTKKNSDLKGIERICLVTYPNIWDNKISCLYQDNLLYYSDIIKENINSSISDREILINELLDTYIIIHKRVKFHFKKANSHKGLHLPKDFNLRPIDDEIYKCISGKIIPRFSWDSKTHFLKKGVGYCLMHKNNFVSISFSAFISKKMIDIGVETHPDYRKLISCL